MLNARINFFIILFSLCTCLNAQVRDEKVNAFDKTKTIRYFAGGYKIWSCPVVFAVEIKGADTLYYGYFRQSISRDQYINNRDGKLGKFEVIKPNGDLFQLPDDYIENAVFSVDNTTYSYSADATIPLTPNIFNAFLDIKGYRINGLGEGTIFKFNKKDPDLYRNIVGLFISDYPMFK